MYPIPQPEFHSHDQDFTDTTSHHPYMNPTRPSSIDLYGTGEDTSIALSYLHDYPEVHLHAPVPASIPYCPPHLANPSQHSSPCVEQGYEGTNNICAPYPQATLLSTSTTTNTNSLDYYTNAPQFLFPTPSELLTDLSTASVPTSTVFPSPLARTTQRVHSQSIEHSAEAPASPAPPANKAENQRKARQRAIAEEIGFIPTDPDTISSHEKKRHYLECLEHYVLYLHDQLNLVNTAPLPFERVPTYRGLSSRSIRTLLVHMQNTNRRLHENTLAEEQMFLDLSAEVMNAHGAGFPTRRHSVDTIGQTTGSHMSPFANCGATTGSTGDVERAFLRFGMTSSTIDKPPVTSSSRMIARTF